ncbi:DinB family protein [Sinomicrobium kalidii]|uniref:DinB family protein n=1 Tax=Sinomicrobium kalidii TaxID=2900738 RepID=UPI001E5A41EE|nr:DUF664 domain-containing protein [Sinomicrobium kalidii]UGU16855.1 DinB family protein [Sinomicrobium kalidii]
MKKEFFLLVLIAAWYAQGNAQVKEISRGWTSFVQSIDVASNEKVNFRLSAAVKVTTDSSEQGSAGLWARVDNKNEETGFFDNMVDRPITSENWQTYTLEGYIDQNSQKLNFGGLCMGDGEFYFDRVELSIQDKNGKFRPVEIPNSGFEKDAGPGNIPNWVEGTNFAKPVRVKEYNISFVKDETYGTQALMIKGTGTPNPYELKSAEGYSLQIGTLVSMLNDLSNRVERVVSGLDQQKLDYLIDEKANRIGALIMHLAAAEKYYQVYTFENRGFNEEENKKWGAALNLGEEGRKEIQGHDLEYYLDIYREVRQKTLEELKKRNDAWLKKKKPGSLLNNHYAWFHVMEHQSSHLGQILFLKKRLPEEEKPQIQVRDDKIKD